MEQRSNFSYQNNSVKPFENNLKGILCPFDSSFDFLYAAIQDFVDIYDKIQWSLCE